MSKSKCQIQNPNDKIFEELKKELPEIQKGVLLAEYTTFKIGGPARYFFKAENKEDLIKAIKTAKKFNLPFFILNAGSKVLFSDKGFNGLVIKTQNSKLPLKARLASDGKTQNHNSKLKTIYAEASAKLINLVRLTEKESLTGLEWAIGIPGAVGGAVFGNAQAFGSKTSDNVESVEVLDANDLKIKNFSNKECQFSLKNSIFKKRKNFIIISVILKLKKGDKKEIQEKIKEFLKYRKNNQPLDFPSAGSIFINPVSRGKIIPAGFLIEKCGLKGKRLGNAQISKKHGNFIVNLGGAKAGDVIKLIEIIKKQVEKKFVIKLKEEIQIIKF